jgi:hypothetical protein
MWRMLRELQLFENESRIEFEIMQIVDFFYVQNPETDKPLQGFEAVY